MDVDEKLTELKKAYADMILNAAKEAAARIMMSERKANRLEFELKESKENALQMLTRLKQMMDSKINEAEMASQVQEKKIEEVEAQLQEAEDIVKDLREELNLVHAEIEKARPENEVKVNPDSIPSSDSNKPQTVYNSLFPFWKSYIQDQDLPSIILKSKGRKLYRSGCTHRIHACVRAPHGQTDVTTPPETDEEGENLHKCPSLGDERRKFRRIGSPIRKKRTIREEDYTDQSVDVVKDLVSVSDIHSGILEEVVVTECEKTEIPLALEATEEKAVESDAVPIRTMSGKVIKYTFQRKRKRGTLKKDENALLETTQKVEKSTEEVKSNEGENEKVISTEEETHLENIAEQLIALSEE